MLRGRSQPEFRVQMRPETPAATSTVADDLFLNQNWKLCGITSCHKRRILFYIWPSIVMDNTFCILGDMTKWTQKMSKNCTNLVNMEQMRQDSSTPLEIRLNFYIQQQVIFLVKSHCSKSSFFVQKFNFDFTRKLSIFWGEKLMKMLWFWTF